MASETDDDNSARTDAPHSADSNSNSNSNSNPNSDADFALSPRLRFIAGARCPECGAEDRVKVGPMQPSMASEAGSLMRVCVACGFSDTIDSLGAVSEPANRLQPAPEPASSPVRLLDPSAPDRG